MTGRLHAWLRQAHSDLAMAVYASEGGFHAQACYHCSQAAEKALKALLLALDQEPERPHSIERLLGALELLGIETGPLRQLPLKPLQRMTTASRHPDGDEAPVDLFRCKGWAPGPGGGAGRGGHRSAWSSGAGAC